MFRLIPDLDEYELIVECYNVLRKMRGLSGTARYAKN